MTKSQKVEWNEIEILVEILCKKILKTSGKFSSITTISRGGLVPARLVADCLDIKKIYVDKKKIAVNSLFVDDIFDSGKTFEKILASAKDPSTLVYATLFARKGKSSPKQLIYGKKTRNKDYVVFPWDKKEFQNSNS